MNSVIENTPTTSGMTTIDATTVAATAKRARQLRKTAQRMVRGARMKDKKYDREYDIDSYITVDRIEWLMKVQDGCCYFYCGSDMLYGEDINRISDKDAVTLERIDSSQAHVTDNCILACASCNGAKGHNMPFDTMRLWAVPVKQKVAKWCNDCKTVKPVDQFYRNKAQCDGLQRQCKACKAIRKAQTYRNTRKRKLAQIEAASADDETESQTD